MKQLCLMLIIYDFVGFRAWAALSSELSQVRHNGQNGDPKQLSMMKNALYSTIFMI